MHNLLLRHSTKTFAVILIATSLSCTIGCRSSERDVWASPSSTPEQKVQAARNLVSIGCSVDEAKVVLGVDGIFARYNSGKSADYFLEYPVTNGYVAIRLEEKKNFDGSCSYLVRSIDYMREIKAIQ